LTNQKNQKLRWAAWISLSLFLLLKASFPHNTTLLYRLLQQIGIPTRIETFHVDGILLLLLFFFVLALFLKEYGTGKTILTLWIAVPVATYLLVGGLPLVSTLSIMRRKEAPVTTKRNQMDWLKEAANFVSKIMVVKKSISQ